MKDLVDTIPAPEPPPSWAQAMEERFMAALEDTKAELKAAITGARQQMFEAYEDALNRVARVESLRPERTTGEHPPLDNGDAT
jgi:hypothetical protein